MANIDNPCGAKCRNGTTCKNAPVRNSKRCRMHGGLTPKGIASPHYKTGRYSKYAYLPDPHALKFQSLQLDMLKNLEESLEIQVAIETSLLEQLELDPPQSNQSENDSDTNALRNAGGGSGNKYYPDSLRTTIKEIQSIHESQRKLTETFVNVRKEVMEVYTQEEWTGLLDIVISVIRNNVTDPAMIRNIQSDLSQKLGGDSAGSGRN